MSELSFLIELLLHHKLPKATRDRIAARLQEVEAAIAQGGYRQAPPPKPPAPVNPIVAQQAPSMQAIMARHPDLVPQQHVRPPRPEEVERPPELPMPAVIAQTPAAVAAMNERQALITAATGAGAFTGKPEPGRTSPRKF